jgi:type VI secretion system ImpC/EvpB family protein
MSDRSPHPLTLWVVGNFTGEPRRTRVLATIDPHAESIDDILRGVAPSVRLACEDPPRLEFRTLREFEPEHVRARLTEAGVERLGEVVHEAAYKYLYASWLGVSHLLRSCEELKAPTVVVLLNITWNELVAGDDTAPISPSLRRTMEELGEPSFGRHPPDAILVDFRFGPRDVGVLSALAAVAAAIGSVVVAAASPEFFPGPGFARLNDVERIRSHFRDVPQFAAWREFRKTPTARYAFLTVPSLLLRPRYHGEEPSASRTRDEPMPEGTERVALDGSSGYLWGNGVYAVGRILAAAYARNGWAAEISPLECPGLTLDYTVERDPSDPTAPAVGPTFAPVWRVSAALLSELGFLALVPCKGTSTVALFDDHSCARPSNTSADPPPSLLYMLGASLLYRSFLRLARTKNLTALARAELTEELARWRRQYGSRDDPAPNAARGPLRDCRVRVHGSSGTLQLEIDASLSYGGGRVGQVLFDLGPEAPAPRLNTRRESLQVPWQIDIALT